MSRTGRGTERVGTREIVPAGATLESATTVTFTQWRILALLVFSFFINYIDRGNLSVAAPRLIKELSIEPAQMGLLLSAFFWTYAASQLFSGWLIDRYNVHWVYGLGFLLWSAATAFTGLVNSFGVLFLFRLILGLGESVAYPACSKIIASDYPEHQRGIANSMVDAGTKVGPALGTLLGGLIVAHWGWRALFLILGLGALLWLPFWFAWTPRAKVHAASEAGRPKGPAMLEILKVRSAWGTFVGLFCVNYAWYFLLTWLPTYLVRERHFTLDMMAIVGSLPFWGIAASSLFGGWLSDSFIKRGGSPTRVRKTFMVTGMLMCTLLLPAAIVQDATVSMVLITIACLAFGLATSNLWAITQSLSGPAAAGKWTGMQNAFGNLAGVTAPYLTGVIVGRTKSFFFAFVAASVVVAVGAGSYAFVVGKLEAHQWKEPSGASR